LHYVNTFFVTFLTFFRDTLGFVEKQLCLVIAFFGIKISQKNSKKIRFSTEKRQILRKKITFSRKIFEIFSFSATNFLLVFFRHFSLLSAKT
ncbi:hypothetical protein, partial [Phascolarctobacterium succinatutens]|uniref:hypothetical protein n=1 Tax=Phascolarctobacterium succinatutens TaxID=626940 RepID=UPI003077E5C2